MRDSDENTQVTDQGLWARVAEMVDDTNRKLATGASWSGHERNHLFFGGLPNYQFERLSGISGLDDPGDSRAFATLDYDHDGWLDIALVNVSAPRLRLMRNEIGERKSSSGHGFVALRLVGGNQSAEPSEKWSNRDGLGTRVALDLGGGAKVYREHRLDDGFKAQNSATMIIGIGRRTAVEAINVRWLSGGVQSTTNVPTGTLLTVYENPAMSPTGEAFVRTVYRNASDKRDRSQDDWRSGLLPHEPSTSTLMIGKSGQSNAGGRSELRLYTTMATWCTACAGEMPEFKALREVFAKDELAMFGVPIDEKDTPTKLRAWQDRLKPAYELLVDLPATDVDKVKGVIAAELRDTSRVPATIVTDATGHVLLADWGVPTVSELRELLWRLKPQQ